MMGERSPPGSLFAADTGYLDFVGRESFYGFLAPQGRELFRDAEFAGFYCPDNGRRSVPPSLLAVGLLLQTPDRVSDEEAKQRADFDRRWKVALGIEIEARPFAKSTLQLFRAQLVIHGEAQSIFRRSLEWARGYLKGRKRRVALDTTVILGRGASAGTGAGAGAHFRQQYRKRVVVEHRIARLVQLGIRQSRFRGRKRTAFQLLMAATVANLTLVAGARAAKGLFRRRRSPLAPDSGTGVHRGPLAANPTAGRRLTRPRTWTLYAAHTHPPRLPRGGFSARFLASLHAFACPVNHRWVKRGSQHAGGLVS